MKKFLATLLTLCLLATMCSLALAEEQITLTFGFWDTNQEPGMKAIAEAYMAEHPNVKIETQVTPWDQYWMKLEAAAMGGALPDISSSLASATASIRVPSSSAYLSATLSGIAISAPFVSNALPSITST